MRERQKREDGRGREKLEISIQTFELGDIALTLGDTHRTQLFYHLAARETRIRDSPNTPPSRSWNLYKVLKSEKTKSDKEINIEPA